MGNADKFIKELQGIDRQIFAIAIGFNFFQLLAFFSKFFWGSFERLLIL